MSPADPATESLARRPRVTVIGGGPAGLMAAESAVVAGCEVDLYDRMGSVGRKILIAGKGGLNLTHSEPFDSFLGRYTALAGVVEGWLSRFDADALREWAHHLGIETVVGSSGRVFPADFKAAPLLRSWVRRLREQGVCFHVLHRWIGWNDHGQPLFERTDGSHIHAAADAQVIAVGGGSWPVLGADPAWVDRVRSTGIAVTPLRASNVGYAVDWSSTFRGRHAGHPVKPCRLRVIDASGDTIERRGEFVITDYGVEGSLLYALGAQLQHADKRVELDLMPDLEADAIAAKLQRPRGKRSLSEHLRRQLKLDGVRVGLLYEFAGEAMKSNEPARLAQWIKALPLPLGAARPIEEAISTAGGIALEELDRDLMLKRMPGVFAAGEMLDWDAPTGGYLLTACLASGRLAGTAAANWAHDRQTAAT